MRLMLQFPSHIITKQINLPWIFCSFISVKSLLEKKNIHLESINTEFLMRIYSFELIFFVVIIDKSNDSF